MMSAPLPALLLAADALLVGAIGWQFVCWLTPERQSELERLLAAGIAGLAVVAMTGVFLGETGFLHLPGFLVVHVLALSVLGLARRSRWRRDVAAAVELGARCRTRLQGPRFEAGLMGLLIVVIAAFVGLAFWSQPVVFDALAYRLARIGYWLQDARITAIVTDDARLTYMPVVPDLIMTWLLTGSSDGYQPAALAQTMGGILLLGATIGLARLSGVNRAASIAAAWMVLGLPNVVPQFTAAYTDLFTGGVLSAGFFLWLRALQRGEGAWFGGIAAGLALGSKGTTAYIAPGLAVVAIGLAWRYRTTCRAWGRTLLGAFLVALVVAVPTTYRNLRAFGGPVGPRDFVVWHHGESTSWSGLLRKLWLNLESTGAQLFEPNSQPPWGRAGLRQIGEAVTRRLPVSDPFTFDGVGRRANLEKVFRVAAPDADVTSTGVMLPLLCVAACVLALWNRRQMGARYVLAWALTVTAFLLVMHSQVQWHPYLYRFVVLVVPWMAVMAVWGLQAVPRWLGTAAWAVVAAGTIYGFLMGSIVTYQSGWVAATQPGQSVGFHVFERWRNWSMYLESDAGPLRPHLPVNQPVAAFLRRGDAKRVEPGYLSRLTAASAQQYVDSADGWLIVPAARYIGREGNVVGRTWLIDGDESNVFSLAAYRALRPGERPPPVVYRNRSSPEAGMERRELLVRTWDEVPLRLELVNHASTGRDYEVRSPLGNVVGHIDSRQRRVVEIRVPANFPTLFVIESPLTGADQPGQLEARVPP